MIDGAQEIRIEGRPQQRKPSLARRDSNERIAVEGVDRRIGEGRGDGSGRALDQRVTGGREEDEGRPLGGDP